MKGGFVDFPHPQLPNRFDFDKTIDAVFYMIAGVIRNNFVSPYLGKNYDTYFMEFDDDQEFVWYESSIVGNNIHSMGDTMSLLAPIRIHFKTVYEHVKSDTELKRLYSKHMSEFVEWVLQSFSAISLWRQHFLIWILETYFPGMSFLARKQLKNRLCYNPREYFLPLFALGGEQGGVMSESDPTA